MSIPHLFVSHASEDKESFVRPLAHALKAKGIPLWYDEFSLKLGDSLRESIDRGLADCKAGLVVLSPAFFAKAWPQRELNALFTADLTGRAKLIPIWHQLDLTEVAVSSSLLADRFAIRSDVGVPAVAEAVAELFPVPPTVSGGRLADVLESFFDSAPFADEVRCKGCEFRFLQLNAFKESFCETLEEATASLSDEEIEEGLPEPVEAQLENEKDRLRSKHRIPDDVYLTSDEPVREDGLAWWLERIREWSSGILSREESAELISEIDRVELDEYYILLDVPNFHISTAQRPLLEQGLIEIGCGYENNNYQKVRELCIALRALDS
jgi:hypothetical protein